jgi:cell pole-organizing protein PopZ
MGQAGAQREPSMEEILASIRRIIENNDPADAAIRGSGPQSTKSGDASRPVMQHDRNGCGRRSSPADAEDDFPGI